MPLKKLVLAPGVNRENTRYTTEGGWYDCDKIRFRQGTPEKIGGWQRLSNNTFLGTCRSLWSWTTLGGINLVGVGTNLKFYIEQGGAYYDITPIRATSTLTNPFETTNGSPIVEVTDASAGFADGDFVTFYGSSPVGGLTILGDFQITISGANKYTIDVGTAATSSAIGGGTVYAVYQVNVGPGAVVPLSGWGAGAWSSGAWGIGGTSTTSIRIWSQSNFGEDLVFGPREGGIYYWNTSLGLNNPSISITIASPAVATTTVSLPDGTPIRLSTTGALPTGLTVGTLYYVVNSLGTSFNLAATPNGTPINTSGTQSGTHNIISRAELLSNYGDASDVPIIQNYLLVSDISRFIFAFGANDFGSVDQNTMLIRWSDQEDPYNWTPAATNQAGSLQLSSGSQIITAIQSRQEVLVWTDAALYALQYVGAPVVWGAQLLGENISIASQNAATYTNGVAYWMGYDKFYKYDGRTQTLRCDIRQYIFNDINVNQFSQVFSGTNEAFNEVWWFYCSKNSNDIDRYAVYNYLEDIWYYGTMARTAWLDSGLKQYPIAATYENNIVQHEFGNDDFVGLSALPITAYITSSEFDLEDGHTFAFVWRVLPDITFRGSTTGVTPQVTMYLLPLQNSGSGYNDPASVGGVNNATVTRTVALPVEEFTGQIFTRVRGRQLAMKIESTGLGVAWQLGAPRIDMRPDGRR
jgi:hypothetical protein